MSTIFISYRRDDGAAYAGRLYDRLAARFGKGQVFMDIDQIEPGEDFVEVINRKVSACEIAVVLIGKAWLSATDGEGRRRLDDPEDFVRLEVAAALERKVRVVPVLVGGAAMPRMQQLPEPLALLSRRNALEISDRRFHSDVDRLIETLERSVVPPVPKTATALPSLGPAPEAAAKAVKRPGSSPSVPQSASASVIPSPAVDTAPAPATATEPSPPIAAAPERTATRVSPSSPPSDRGSTFEIKDKAASVARAIAGRIPGKVRQLPRAADLTVRALLWGGALVVVVLIAARAVLGPNSGERVASESQHTSTAEVKPADAVTPSAAAPAAPSVSTAALVGDVIKTPDLIKPDRAKSIPSRGMLTGPNVLYGVTQEMERKLLTLAASGSAEAQFELGVMHENGFGDIGFTKTGSLDEAAKWYRLAAKQEYPLAKQGLIDVGVLAKWPDKARDPKMIERSEARASARFKIFRNRVDIENKRAKEVIQNIGR